MVKPVRKTTNKNPPVLSHEFIIQNHADIVSCVAMVFVVGLMVQVSPRHCYYLHKSVQYVEILFLLQATTPIASIFIALQHNVTEPSPQGIFYSPGVKDWASIFFYCLICIIIHAVIQEYVLDVSMINKYFVFTFLTSKILESLQETSLVEV